MPTYRSVTVTAASTTASTASPWVPLNLHGPVFEVGFGVNANPGTGHLTFTVQHAFQNIHDTSLTIEAYNHATLAGIQVTASISGLHTGSYLHPISAIRIAVVSGSGVAPSATLHVFQPGY